MQKFWRIFRCKTCKTEADIDEMTPGIVIVECKTCKGAELADESEILEGLEHFEFDDKAILVA